MYNNNDIIPNTSIYEPIAYREMLKVDAYKAKLYYKAKIDVEKNEALIMQKADLTTKRELQQTNISIRPSGEVFVERDIFHGKICTPLQIKVEENIIYFPLNQEDKGWVLKLAICNNISQQKVTLWIAKNLYDEKKVKTVFQRTGISFGFGSKKEAEIRLMFITAAINSADPQIIPVEHGWFKLNDTFVYAYPDETVWKEAFKNAERCLL